MITPAIQKLILDRKIALAVQEIRRTTDCSIKTALKIVRKWKRDRANKIGR